MKPTVVALVMLMLVVSTGCIPTLSSPTRPCDEILPAWLRVIGEEGMTPAEAVMWIEEQGGTTPRQEQFDEGVGFYWQRGDDWYSVYFRGDTWYRTQIIYEPRSSPTGRMVAECLGPPEAYSAYTTTTETGASFFNLTLFYPQDGLMLSHGAYSYDNSPSPSMVDGGLLQIRSLLLLPPSPVEEMVQELYVNGEQEEADVLQSVKPWPGDWETLPVDVKDAASFLSR